MLFNSPAFAVFLPIVFIVYWILPHRFRWGILLMSSYYFYMSWNAKYIFLILGMTVVSYVGARLIDRENAKYRKAILCATLILCFGLLFFFKYFKFSFDSLQAVLDLISIKLSEPTLNIVLPVGISFYTFQVVSYVIDVYKHTISAEKHFGKYAAFISFFPQLVAGPIERTSNLLPQIKAEHKFNYEKARYGMVLMLWGFYKKLVIADFISQYVSAVYDNPRFYAGFSLVTATLLFSIQIYCDFSGYSDIAIGTAKLLDIDLMTNFKAPYFSKSIKEFWQRWHISLSSWLRDYVYIPLGGSRVGRIKKYRNLMITFLVSGLWHGANWTFVLWGGIHGAINIMEDAFGIIKKEKERKVIDFLRIIVVFLLVSFAWIFFVSNTVSDAFYTITHMQVGIGNPVRYLHDGMVDLGISKSIFARIVGTVLLLLGVDGYCVKHDFIEFVFSRKKVIRHLIYWLLLLLVIFLGSNGASEFVYFQF